MKGIFVTIAVILFLYQIPAFANHPPILFIHGYGITADFYDAFTKIEEEAREQGFDLYLASKPSMGTLQARATKIRKEIDRLIPEGRFHIVGHSQGGVDARYLVHLYPEIADRVISITTLSTPHHGSRIADWLVQEQANQNDKGQEKTSLWRLVLKHVFGNNWEGVKELTTHYMDDVFNLRVPNVPSIKYYSMSFKTEGPALLVSPLPWVGPIILLHRQLGETLNDGVVAAERAVWGESWGIREGDHWAQTAPIPYRGQFIYRQIFSEVFHKISMIDEQ